MVIKIECLQNLNKTELLELGRNFDIKVLSAWPKGRIIDTLNKDARVTKNAIETILAKKGEGKGVKEILRERRDGFYNETAGQAFCFCEDLGDELGYGLLLASIADEDLKGRIKETLNKFDKLKVFEIQRAPKGVKLSEKQKKVIFGTSRKSVWRYKIVSEKALESVDSHETFLLYNRIKNDEKIPERLKHYIKQGLKCYYIESFDAAIVMFARSIEYALKEFFSKRNPVIVVGERDTLGALIKKYREQIGEDKLLQKIMEVHNMDRIICAHDIEPFEKEMGLAEANHAWTALIIILKDMINLKI
ncbi:MAG: hypothetical protein ABIE55_01275 [Candidatus Aenigmatarchaeota archaeon]